MGQKILIPYDMGFQLSEIEDVSSEIVIEIATSREQKHETIENLVMSSSVILVFSHLIYNSFSQIIKP